ncbi:MAG: NUDIX hydrolase [Roseinatronobacter sp.]
MNITVANSLDKVMEILRPSFIQVAALCLRDGAQGPEVALVQTFERRRWVIPKGWPMKGKSLAEAATIEAWEEAGVRGVTHPAPIGAFTYTKFKKSGLPVRCRPQVFRIDVREVHDSYPEAQKRVRHWATVPEAIALVQNPELKVLLGNL